MAVEATTLVESLELAARFEPERGIGIYDGRGRRLERRTYPELLASALAAGSRLAEAGVGPGDRVLISLPTSWEWMENWLGALVLGALPAAMAPAGTLGSSEGYAAKVEGLMERIGARKLVAASQLREDLQTFGAPRALESFVTPEELASLPSDPALKPATPDPDHIAFLQFTSGSTGLPRAVMIPHRAAIHNNDASDEAIGAPFGRRASEWTRNMVSWLPMHHDMGLIGCLFLSINHRFDLSLLSPTAFLARPRLWLEKLGEAGMTFAPAPNFGYQLCVERVRPDDLASIDLSGWRSAMTGAEMVRPDTCSAFVELTEASGFRPESLCPCYGLAEGTLAVTFDMEGRGLRTRPVPEGADAGLGLTEVVSVGRAIRDTEVQISAPDGSPLPDGQIGEVRATGPGIFAGYYNDPEATAEGLRDGWLCTGDLGFLYDGELYLTGRTKDLLIIKGNNVMPHELEWIAESVASGGGSQRCGAFSITRGAEGEEAVVVMETTEKDPARLDEMAQEIRVRIGRAMALPLADMMFVRRGKIPKTTSGKVQRKQLKQSYLEGELERIG